MIATWIAPGRVNLIGEHTDYNGGYCLPFAIPQSCRAVVETRSDGVLTVGSAQHEDEVHVPIEALHPGVGDWAGYALGAAWVARERGASVPGLDIRLDSDVPYGAGLSPSAAVVCSVVCAVDDLLRLHSTPEELLSWSRRVENDFVGAPTGGMDQLASLRSVEGSALLCDMRGLTTRPVPLPLAGHCLVVLDTKAPHRHADGEYRRRREGCEQAAARLGVPLLRDIGIDGLDAALARLDDDEQRRYTRHIVTENDRVLRAVDALERGDLPALGHLLDEAHVSVRDDFRITVPIVDLAVETFVRAGALGARMTGGGFGGCVIALLAEDLVEPATAAVADAFAAAGHRAPEWFIAAPAAGAHRENAVAPA